MIVRAMMSGSGLLLGLATFFLVDDVLDFTGISSSLRKGSISDICHACVSRRKVLEFSLHVMSRRVNRILSRARLKVLEIDTRSTVVDTVVDNYDAITLSPHKFLGGPGSPGILLMYEALYKLKYSYIDMMKPVGLGRLFLNKLELQRSLGFHNWYQSHVALDLGSTRCFIDEFMKAKDICTCLEAVVISKNKGEEAADLSKAVYGLWDASIMEAVLDIRRRIGNGTYYDMKTLNLRV
ncbi:hypothetical protein Tco_1353993 [Tanacetum coccineum]